MSNAQYRRQSYVNLESALMLQPDTNEIEEDFASGDSGSTKNSKKVQPLFSDPNNANAQRLAPAAGN